MSTTTLWAWNLLLILLMHVRETTLCRPLLLHLQSTPSSCCQTLVVLPTIARAPLRHLLLKNTLLHLYRMCFALLLRSISVHVSNRTTKPARLCVSILLLLRQGLMLLVLLLLRLLMIVPQRRLSLSPIATTRCSSTLCLLYSLYTLRCGLLLSHRKQFVVGRKVYIHF